MYFRNSSQQGGCLLEVFTCRVCQENAYLMSCLEARSEELRRANCHKMGEFITRWVSLSQDG